MSAGTSSFRVYRPSGALAPYVDFFWSCERYVAPHVTERVLPTATADVIFRGDGCEMRGGLTGPRSKYIKVSTAGPFTAVGVHFTPGGAYPFVGEATKELVDASAPLTDLWGPAADAVLEQLARAPGAENRFRVLEQMLLARLPRAFVPRPAITRAMHLFEPSGGLMPIVAVAERVGVPRRRFVEEFRSQVGVSPKVFCRLRRFSGVLHRIASGADVDWADVAYAAGYWDQAHFNHEFREFCGLTPTEYLARRVAPTHVAEPGSDSPASATARTVR